MSLFFSIGWSNHGSMTRQLPIIRSHQAGNTHTTSGKCYDTTQIWDMVCRLRTLRCIYLRRTMRNRLIGVFYMAPHDHCVIICAAQHHWAKRGSKEKCSHLVEKGTCTHERKSESKKVYQWHGKMTLILVFDHFLHFMKLLSTHFKALNDHIWMSVELKPTGKNETFLFFFF